MLRFGISRVIAASFCSVCFTVAGEPLPRLDAARPVRLELGPGETKSVLIAATKGEFLEIVSEAEAALAVKTNLFNAAGEHVGTAPSLGGTGGRAIIDVFSEAAGEFRLDVQNVLFRKEQRVCTVRLAVSRPATDRDRADAQAHRAFASAADVAGKGEPQQLRAAAQALDEPIRLARTAGDRLLEVRALFGTGQFLAMAGDLRPALPWFEQALPLARALGEQRAEAHLLSVIALVHTNLEEHAGAIESYLQALKLERATEQRWETALTLDNLAQSEAALGRLDLSLEYLNEEILIRRELDDELGLNQSLVGLADINLSLGGSGKALDALVQTIPHWAALKDSEFESETWNKLGIAYMSLGDYQLADTALRHALRLQESAPQPRVKTDVLLSMGRLEALRGETGASAATFANALALAHGNEFRRGETEALEGIADVAERTGKPRDALDKLDQALRISLDIGDRYHQARIRNRMGLARGALKDPAAARREFENALTIENDIGDRLGQIWSLTELAKLDRAGGNPSVALGRIDEARALVEATRSTAPDPDLRATWLASEREVYELSASMLMDLSRRQPAQSYAARAFFVSEQAHARALLEALGNVRTRSTGEARSALTVEAKALDAAIHARAAGTLGDRFSLRVPLASLLEQREQIELRIRQEAGGAAEDQSLPASLDEIRRRALSKDTALLEYLVGPAGSHLWLVTRAGLRHFPIPSEAVLEPAVRRFYSSLTARNRAVAGESAAGRQTRLAAADQVASIAAASLSRMLLPPGDVFPSERTLLIVADGPLQYVPFAALPAPDGDRAALGESRNIVALPSASVLARMRQSTPPPPPDRVLVVADPVYSANDERVASIGRGGTRLIRAGALVPRLGNGDFARLHMSEVEAATIARLAAPRRTTTLLGFDASMPRLANTALDQFRFIHVAAHTVVDTRHPDLSGVALSLIDPRGRGQDGFLRLADIYNLRLNADLVTLSACESTLGRDVRGEGLLGLSRGFLYAGARRVLGTLWSVDDRATAMFMEHFYRALFEQKLRPPAALRAAQRELQADPRWHAAYYWAGFTLQGEWE